MKRFVNEKKQNHYNVWVGEKSGGFNVDKFIWGKINPNNVSNMEKYIVF